MKLLLKFLNFGWVSVIIFSCNNAENKNYTSVSFHLYPSTGAKVYLYKVPLAKEKLAIADSATLTNPGDSIVFKLPKEKDRLYYIEDSAFYKRFYFITDTNFINIHANILSGKCTVTGSPASISLNNFQNSQNKLSADARQYLKTTDSLYKNGSALVRDSVNARIQNYFAIINHNSRAYADTVASPAAFLYVYNNIDFDHDYKDLKMFITKAAARFSNYASIQDLKKSALDYISIFEVEYNVGDSLPILQLPDINGKLFSTGDMRSKYYLVDFWASWCPSCMKYKPYEKSAWQKIDSSKFKMVSVALDDNVQICKKIIRENNYNWIQLVDTCMWQGVAVNTLKFDSIPFNFLVSPSGKIIAKAIKPAELSSVLDATIK